MGCAQSLLGLSVARIHRGERLGVFLLALRVTSASASSFSCADLLLPRVQVRDGFRMLGPERLDMLAVLVAQLFERLLMPGQQAGPTSAE